MEHQTKMPNRLINENSPYLLQHAYNPVNWYPWGKTAFQKAKKENKLIFLSIGYSTCHWCHVMEEESFEDETIAALLNRSFVSIKVDREERPDVDSVYMQVCQALTGSGGWPLTILMTPEQKPFFAGTYFPKERKYGQVGLAELLELLALKWEQEESSVLAAGSRITQEISQRLAEPFPQDTEIDRRVITKAFSFLQAEFDEQFGGFGNAPKFPSPHNLLFLLQYHSVKAEGEALPMVLQTLNSMYRGGIFDHIGYGFSRYATDRKWLAPHFEKMLYDNALLTLTYTEAYQATENPLYRYIAAKTLAYVEREMTHPDGGFYSAQDADSEAGEGSYYTWSQDEILSVLGPEEGPAFCREYDITPNGNFEGKNILNRIQAPMLDVPSPQTESFFHALRQVRAKRYSLHKDDKCLTAWNAMMIAAYAKAGIALRQKEYLHAAVRALHFIETRMLEEDGRPVVSYRNGKSGQKGLLDDYAYLAWAYLNLYENTCSPEYLMKCQKMIDNAVRYFADPAGGFFLSPSDADALIYRPKEFYDGAMPSGNSVLTYCIVRLGKLLANPKLEALAQQQLTAFSGLFLSHPASCTFALKALFLELFPTRELIGFVPDAAAKEQTLQALAARYRPELTVHLISPAQRETFLQLLPFLQDYAAAPADQSVFYLCQNKSCSAPIYGLQGLLERLP